MTALPKSGSPAYSLGSRLIVTSRSTSPSPATYKIESKTLSPRWTFGNSERRSIVTTFRNAGTYGLPGPGQYDVSGAQNIVLKKGPSFSMKSRTRIGGAHDGAGPGPATYGGIYTQFD